MGSLPADSSSRRQKKKKYRKKHGVTSCLIQRKYTVGTKVYKRWQPKYLTCMVPMGVHVLNS